MVQTAQTNVAKLDRMLAQMRELHLITEQAGGHPGNLMYLLKCRCNGASFCRASIIETPGF